MNLITCLNLLIGLSYACDKSIKIDLMESNFTKFKPFWKSTGFCPPDPKENIPDFLLSHEQTLNIALIGSLPNKGIEHVRVHWLLNLLTSKLVNGNLVFNFTSIDTFLTHLNENGLCPGFELMGASNGNVTFKKEMMFWKALVENLVTRYIEKFGTRPVSKWRFESWNEPDLKGYNILNFTLPEYQEYILGCYEGITSAFRHTHYTFKFGGPAGLFKDPIRHPLCWGMLEACQRDKCPLSFISFHKKGNGTAEGVLNGTLQFLDEMQDKFPGLEKKPIANDESDIEVNWSRSLDWRADVRYAAMVVKVIASYYKSVGLRRKLKIEVLSNDNAFLNYHPFYFTQRTLFARFQINTTRPHQQQFIKKPVYSLMALLSFLGDEVLMEPIALPDPDPLLTVIATRSGPGKKSSFVSGGRSFDFGARGSFVSVIAAYGNGSHSDIRKRILNLAVVGFLRPRTWKYVVYRMDNIHTNPYEIWKKMGMPVYPGRAQRQLMRDVEEPERLTIAPVKNSSLNVTLNLTLPSVYLIHVCNEPGKFPNKVHRVRFFNITWNEVLITWKDKNKRSGCLLTYEVEFRQSGLFERINDRDTIFSAFHHVGTTGGPECETTRGEYRVRAVDYWNRFGEYSDVVRYS